MTDDWSIEPEEGEEAAEAGFLEPTQGSAEAETVETLDSVREGTGLDGSTPFEAGIQGRLTHAGGTRESARNDYDWQPQVEVDQPVQREDD